MVPGRRAPAAAPAGGGAARCGAGAIAGCGVSSVANRSETRRFILSSVPCCRRHYSDARAAECPADALSGTDSDAGCRACPRRPPFASRGAAGRRRCSRVRTAAAPRAAARTGMKRAGRAFEIERRQHVLDLNDVVRRLLRGALDHRVQLGEVPGHVSAASSASAGLRERARRARLARRTSRRAHAPPAPAHRRRARGAAAGRSATSPAGGTDRCGSGSSCTSASMPGAALATQRRLVGDRLAVEPHFAVTRDAREPRLHGRRELGDVLQEQRAAARRGDLAVSRNHSRSPGAVSGAGAKQQARRAARDRPTRSRPGRTAPRRGACARAVRARRSSTSAPRSATSRTPPSASAARRTSSWTRAIAAERPTSSSGVGEDLTSRARASAIDVDQA